MADAHLNSMMENLYWWGIQTRMRGPHQEATDQDRALVGVTQDTGNGTTKRDEE